MVSPEDTLKSMKTNEPSGEHTSILVVEDHPSMRELIEAILKDAGYEVMTAGDGDEALRIIRENKVDLLLTDLRMPRLSGNDLVQQIQAQSHVAGIIIMSGCDSDVVATHAPNVRFLPKPFTPR